MHGGKGREIYVAHKARPDSNMIFPDGDFFEDPSRLLVISLNISSNLTPLYFTLAPEPNRMREVIRGLPKTSCPSFMYSDRQSGTVIRNRPSIIAISLRDLSAIHRRAAVVSLRSTT